MTAALGGSVLCGWFCFTILDQDQQAKEANVALHRGRQPKLLSQEEARLRAMIEQAKESNWKENLDNAVQAQEYFMLPGRSQGDKPSLQTKSTIAVRK